MRRLVVLCATAVLLFSCSESSPTRRLTQPSDPPVVSPTAAVGPQVHGLVSDVSGRPLAGAQVEWTGVAEDWGGRGRGVLTSTEGAYTIRVNGLDRTPGAPSFGMRATKTGYVEQIVLARFADAVDGLEVNFQLSPTQ